MPHQRPTSPPGLSHHLDGSIRLPVHQKASRPSHGLKTMGRSAGSRRECVSKAAARRGVGSSIEPIGQPNEAPPLGEFVPGDQEVETGWWVDGPLPETLALGEPIGKGTFGSVLAAKCTATGSDYAVKVLRKRRAGFPAHVMKARILNEVSIWRDMQGCEDIVHLHKCYEDADYVYLVQDLCTGGTLHDVMKARDTLGEAEAAVTIACILRMVQKCHSHNIVYADVKPSNFVACPSLPISACMDGQQGACGIGVKAVDFGSAKRLEAGTASMMVESGTPLYAAPEVHEPPYGLESDVWSTGVLLYQLLSGEPPFVKAVAKTMRDLNPTSLAFAIAYVKLSFEGDAWEGISGGAKELISKMLERDVGKRITAKDALSHPWIKLHVEDPGAGYSGPVCSNIVRKNGCVWEQTESKRGF